MLCLPKLLCEYHVYNTLLSIFHLYTSEIALSVRSKIEFMFIAYFFSGLNMLSSGDRCIQYSLLCRMRIVGEQLKKGICLTAALHSCTAPDYKPTTDNFCNCTR